MSMQSTLPGFEGRGGKLSTSAEALRASLAREMAYLLASSRNPCRGFSVSPAGIAHSLGVCLIEDGNMARGKGKGFESGKGAGLPTFVDVKLSSEQRENFLSWLGDDLDAVKCLQSFADQGYRVGVSWSGEHQTYTVSATCRDEESENNGLCMTSFSRSLTQAVLLAWYKHDVVCSRKWRQFDIAPTDTFG